MSESIADDRPLFPNPFAALRSRPYTDMEHLAASIEEFIDRYYNRCRLHLTLGYRSPEQFEKQSERRSEDDRQMRMVWVPRSAFLESARKAGGTETY